MIKLTQLFPNAPLVVARGSMVTTLIAQMSGLLAPISKSATRTSSTCTNGTVRGISLVCRVQQHRQWRRGREKVRTSPPSLLRSYGEAPASLTPRRGTLRRSVSEGGWRRECQSIPIERSSIFDLLDQNPLFELPPENGFSPSTKACPTQWPVVDNSATKRLAKGKLPSHR